MNHCTCRNTQEIILGQCGQIKLRACNKKSVVKIDVMVEDYRGEIHHTKLKI